MSDDRKIDTLIESLKDVFGGLSSVFRKPKAVGIPPAKFVSVKSEPVQSKQSLKVVDYADAKPAKAEKRTFSGPDYAWHQYISVKEYDKDGDKDPSLLVLTSSKYYKGAKERLVDFLKDLKLKAVEGQIRSGQEHYLVVVDREAFERSKITVDVVEPTQSFKVGQYDKNKKDAYGVKEKWISAGGVVVTDDYDHVYVRKPSNNYGPWAFPKGRVDAGESLTQAALREVEEEIGIKGKILPGGYLGSGVGGYSITHFFVMLAVGGDPSHHDKETEEVRLVTWKEALELLANAGNGRDVKVAMKAWEYARRVKKQKGGA